MISERTITTSSEPSRPLRVCHECDLVSIVPPLACSESARCPRCQHELMTRKRAPAQHALALAIAAVVALVTSLAFPFISFSASGFDRAISLTDAMTILSTGNYTVLAVVLWMVLLLLPMLYLGMVIVIHGALLLGRRPPRGMLMLRTLRHIEHWMMADVFLIGVLVSLVKILSLASIGFGLSFWAFCLFVVLMLLISRSVDRDWLWSVMAPEPPPPEHARTGQTAQAQKLVGCPVCGTVNDYHHHRTCYCSRCGEKLHMRRRHSVQKTLALLVVSVLLYIPAMVLPIMTVSSLNDTTTQTVIGGVLLLIDHGDYPIAAIIFLASVVIPVAKLMALLWLCIKVGRPQPWRPEVRMTLYRITEFIGRWSMIDVFVVALLAALVRLGVLMHVSAEPGIIAFGGVVILTMIAAMSFDPRLIWDAADHPDLENNDISTSSPQPAVAGKAQDTGQ
ncbi:paraquat-inducible membrane protein A [Kushneria konosiri]|uniref:Paraquat-inducible membrane protein A n=1 Tax=Kushneria konosiri TaxID=698828 RepID=A0A2Z2HKZ8_9GAMM|nr:paraquat-inducible membrane protein A [Kushneria konosiri]